MKILKKLGAVITGFLLSVKALAVKVYAINSVDFMEPAYGVYPPEPATPSIAKIFSTILIPVILLIGLIVYFIKSKSKVWVKLAITILVIALYILFRVIIDNI